MDNIKEYVLSQLNEEQGKAALHTETSSLILAGAGSGKTRTVTYKIAYLIFGLHVDPRSILAVTFTNKASNEMKERIMHIANEIGGPRKLSLFKDFFWMGTFHGVFLKFLKEELANGGLGYTSSFGVYDENESTSLLKESIKQLKMEEDIEVKEAKSFISKLKGQGLTVDKFKSFSSSDYEQTMFLIYESYQKKLAAANSLDFDDLLLLPYVLLNGVKEIKERWQDKFSYIMVDEAQDTNWIQFELMKLLGKSGAKVTMIGDDYQSIYRWRGAVMENFLNVKSIWQDIEIFKLETNYRSRAHIVHAGSSLIKKNSRQYEKNITAHRQESDKIMVQSYRDEIDEAQGVVEQIGALIKKNMAQAGDITILYRTNAQSAPLEQVFLAEGIPYKVYGGFKFFERKEIKDVVSYLKYLINPRDVVAFKRVINVPKRKIGPDSVVKLEEYSLKSGIGLSELVETIDYHQTDLGKSATTQIKGFSMIIKILRQQMESSSPDKIIEQLLSLVKYKEYLISSEGLEVGNEKYENIGQLINMALKYQEGNGIALMQQFLEEISLMTDLEEKDGGSLNAVKLMSIHSSKGLEFQYVFLVGVEENIFPLQKAQFDDAELEEERRLMYVAITRAKDHLFMSYAGARKQRGQQKYNAPSRFIEDIPEEYKLVVEMGGYNPALIEKFELDDRVKHKLFGMGAVIEIWTDDVIVVFDRYGTRKVPSKHLEKQ